MLLLYEISPYIHFFITISSTYVKKMSKGSIKVNLKTMFKLFGKFSN